MPHSYTSCLFHCVFSTSKRRRLLTPELRTRLFPFLTGIARNNQIKIIAIGGIEDHVHILLSIPSTMHIAKTMQLIKAGSSKWIHETFPKLSTFEWQEGYGAFSLSISHLKETITYIENQETHHQKQSFEEELKAFLYKHNITYDERYLLG
jgi:REP element-mobilizing transposase RayT